MATKIQFINSTGDFSQATRQEQTRLVRSHVATRRQRIRRQQEIDNQIRRLGIQLPSEPTPTLSLTSESPPDVTRLHSVEKAVKERGSDQPDEQANQPEIENHPPNRSLDQSMPAVTESETYDELRPVHEGGHLLPLPITPSPFSYLGQGLKDPFTCMPFIKSHRMSKHLFYYVNVLTPSMHPSYSTNLVRRTFGCASFQYADELMLASITAFSATSRALAAGDIEIGSQPRSSRAFHDGAYDWLYFKGKTIRLINERLTVEGSVDIADETLVGSICSLIVMEAFTGNVHEAQAHMTGLRRIAFLWQTQSRKPMPFKVASSILLAAVKLSILTNTPPFVPFNLTFKKSLPLPSVSHILPGLGSHLLLDLHKLAQNNWLLPIVHDLMTMTRYTEAVFEWLFPYAEDDTYMEYINYRNMWIEHRLLSLHTSSDVEEAFRLAALLYLNTVLMRGWPNNSAIIRSISKSLKNALEKSFENIQDGSTAWTELKELLLWVVFVGAHCSHQHGEEAFFVRKFRNIATELGIKSRKDALELLSRYLYVERVYGESATRIVERSL